MDNQVSKVNTQSWNNTQNGSTAGSNFPAPKWRQPPKKLEAVDNGAVVQRLWKVRKEYESTPPNEIYLLLNPAEVGATAEAQFVKSAREIEGWRNILVLAPLMLTWISLGLASLAYSQSITFLQRAVTKTPLLADPFLKQWAEGFPLLSEVHIGSIHLPLLIGSWRYFNFSDVVGIDFLLLFLLLFLTWIAHTVEIQAYKDGLFLSTWMREECAILRDASFARSLGPGPGNDAPQWAVIVMSTIRSLETAIGETRNLIQSFDSVLQKDRQSVADFIQSIEGIEKAVDNLNKIFQAGKDTYESLDATLPQIAQHFKTMAESQDGTVRSLNTISRDMSDAAKAIATIAGPFSQAGVAAIAHETTERLRWISEQQYKTQRDLENLQGNMSSAAHATTPPFWRRLFGRLGR